MSKPRSPKRAAQQAARQAAPALDSRQIAQLEGITQALTGRYIRFQAMDPAQMPTAAFDPRGQRIMINRDAPFMAAIGLVGHEILHEKYTSSREWDSLIAGGIPKGYVNIAEDMRINSMWQREYPYFPLQVGLQAGWDWIRQTKANGTLDPSTPSMSVLYTASGQTQIATKPWDADALAWLTTEYPGLCSAPSTEDIKPYAESLKALDEKWGKKADQGDEQGEGQAGKSKPGQGGSAGEEAQEGTGAGQGSKGGEAVYDESATDQSQDPGKMGSVDSHGQAPFPMSDPARCQDVRSDVAAILRGWRNRMADALMAKDKTAWTPQQRRGALDVRRLTDVACGEDQVFMSRDTEKRAVNTAVDVLLDISGSTAGPVGHYIAASGYALGEACSRVPGVQVGLAQFEGTFRRIRRIGPGRGIRIEDAPVADLGGTETTSAMLRSCAELKASSCARKIMLIITDGALGSEDTHQLVKSQGVEVYAVSVIEDIAAGTLESETGERNHVKASYDMVPAALDQMIHQLRITGRV